MARPIRKKSGTGIYHVMLRGINGHLFQDRFRSDPVDSIEYFVVLLRYIHQNPLKAGIVEDIINYPWSSWKEYVTDDCKASFCSTKAVFSRVPGRT